VLGAYLGFGPPAGGLDLALGYLFAVRTISALPLPAGRGRIRLLA